MADQSFCFLEPDFEFAVHGGGEEDVVLEVGQSGDFALVAILEVVEFEGLQVVESDVLVHGIVVLFGEVDVLALSWMGSTFVVAVVPKMESLIPVSHSILTLWS